MPHSIALFAIESILSIVTPLRFFITNPHAYHHRLPPQSAKLLFEDASSSVRGRNPFPRDQKPSANAPFFFETFERFRKHPGMAQASLEPAFLMADGLPLTV